MQSYLKLYIITSGQIRDSVYIFSKYMEAVSKWMGPKKLKLNLSKMDLLLDYGDFQSPEKESRTIWAQTHCSVGQVEAIARRYFA